MHLQSWLKNLEKKGDKPIVKGAYIDESIYIGDSELSNLADLKSKEELIGEIIGLLQSPIKNVVSGLNSSGDNIAGILKTLENR
jgi:large subunit ribosomal protein L10